ncbi:MAG TPA: hypothetical protein ENN19_16595 [Chloroflexi bacterium]|nr:hypothetical protein [Chloroflexota bacterium]
MYARNIFWAAVLILVGLLLLLSNLGIIQVDVWSLVGPFFLITLGVWVLWSAFVGPGAAEAEEIIIPLEGATSAHVHVEYGAGRLRVGADTASDELLNGRFGGGLKYRASSEGDKRRVKMDVPFHDPFSYIFHGSWGRGRGAFDWTFGLNEQIPLALEFEVGAAQTELDLTDLQVTDLRLETGASATSITLPARAGHTRAKISAGAASVSIRIPPDVAARIHTSGGLASIDVDRERFPRQGKMYQSPGYEAAANKVDLDVEAGVGSITVR